MKISPNPSLPKRGEFLPFAKGGEEGFRLQCLCNYGLISNYDLVRRDGQSYAKALDGEPSGLRRPAWSGVLRNPRRGFDDRREAESASPSTPSS